MAEKKGFLKIIMQWRSSRRRLTQEHINASIEASATLTPLSGIGRRKRPCYQSPTPNSRDTQPE